MINLKILFPSNPLNKNFVDPEFTDEHQSCKLMGIDTYFYDYDLLVNENKFMTNIDKNDQCLLIYRGWMLKPEQYSFLYNKILERTNGYITLINSPEQYNNCHCFPYIYEDIKDITPKISVIDNIDDESLLNKINSINFDFFIKDYVKSVKINNKIEILPKLITLKKLKDKINEFIKERGNLFTNGIVLKEYVKLKNIFINNKEYTNEWRAFYLYGKLLDLSNNSNINVISKLDSPPIEMVKNVGYILSNKSNFFTVDFAQKENGQWIVIESGDGQVSGISTNLSSLGFLNKIYHNI